MKGQTLHWQSTDQDASQSLSVRLTQRTRSSLHARPPRQENKQAQARRLTESLKPGKPTRHTCIRTRVRQLQGQGCGNSLHEPDYSQSVLRPRRGIAAKEPGEPRPHTNTRRSGRHSCPPEHCSSDGEGSCQTRQQYKERRSHTTRKVKGWVCIPHVW